MRTKTLLLTAALVAAGVASSMAQSNVYSLNVVGYVNLSITNGFNLISNPLDADGTGTNNTLSSVFGTNVPFGTVVYLFNNSDAQFDTIKTYSSTKGWGSTPTPFNPGQGAFLSAPSSFTLTLVGQVLQGSLTNKYLNPAGGFSLIGSVAPVGGPINGGVTNGGGIGYTNATFGDVLYKFNPADQNYDIIKTYSSTKGWSTSPPVLGVGEGFWLSLAAPNTWTQSFIVQ